MRDTPHKETWIISVSLGYRISQALAVASPSLKQIVFCPCAGAEYLQPGLQSMTSLLPIGRVGVIVGWAAYWPCIPVENGHHRYTPKLLLDQFSAAAAPSATLSQSPEMVILCTEDQVINNALVETSVRSTTIVWVENQHFGVDPTRTWLFREPVLSMLSEHTKAEDPRN